MKTMKSLISKALLCFLIVSAFTTCAFSQQFLTQVAGWNAYVHLPDDYSSTKNSYPAIVFFPGTGEVGTDASRLLVYGPSYFISNGSNLDSFHVNGQTVKPIIISLQPTGLYPPPWVLDIMFDSVLARWRIDPTRLNVTGLSMGGFCPDNYVTQSSAYAGRINAVVAMSAVIPNNPITNFSYFALTGGKWWGFEGTQDYRGLSQIRDTMNRYSPGSARYTSYVGGHCCWNTWYDPAYTESINGQNWNIYQWMLAQTKGGAAVPVPPTVSAGSAQIIKLPNNSVTLTGNATGNNGAKITQVYWTETSGAPAVITSQSTLTTTVTGLKAGNYSFQLSATDNNGLVSTSLISITVNPLTTTPPTVNAGNPQTVLLAAGTGSSGGQAASFNFSNSAVSIPGWTNMHGSPGSSVVSATDPAGIGVNSVSPANWAPVNGGTSYNQNGVNTAGYFNNAAVSVNNWYQFGSPAVYNLVVPQLHASGLVPGKSYTVKISGSNVYSLNANPCRYTIQGLSGYGPIDVNENGTSGNGATFTGVYPYADGTLNIFLNAVPGVSELAMVDGLQITQDGAGSAGNVVSASASTVLNGTATGNNGASIVSTAWLELSGPSSATISSAANLSTNVSGLVAGIYSFQLTAKDNQGLSNSSAVTVTVTATVTAPPVNKSPNKLLQVRLYGGTNPFNDTSWNNWNVSAASAGPVSSSAFTYSDGGMSPIIATLSYGQGVADNGPGYGGTIVSSEVLRYSSYNSSNRTLTINNIPFAGISTLEIYGSRANTGNSTIYTINNGSVTLVTDGNLTNSAIFNNVQVTKGQLIIQLGKLGNFDYINGFRLTFPDSTITGSSLTNGSELSIGSSIGSLNGATGNLSVYPDPAKDMINIAWSNAYTGNATMILYDAGGKAITTVNFTKLQGTYTSKMILNQLTQGIYYLVIKWRGGGSISRTVIKI